MRITMPSAHTLSNIDTLWYFINKYHKFKKYLGYIFNFIFPTGIDCYDDTTSAYSLWLNHDMKLSWMFGWAVKKNLWSLFNVSKKEVYAKYILLKSNLDGRGLFKRF